MINFSYILAAGFGLILGSFLNVVIVRGPAIWGLEPLPEGNKRYDLAWPRSHCPKCGTQLTTSQLIPVFSYFWLRGKCAHCAERISLHYPAVELLTAGFAIFTLHIFGLTTSAAAAFTFFCFLICLAFIDARTKYLPDALTLPLLMMGIAINLPMTFVPLVSSVIGALIGFLVFWAIGEAFYRLRGIEGLGRGDAKLLAALGAWLGWSSIPVIVLIAAISGLAWTGISFLKRKPVSQDTEIPFGPFLALAGSITMIALQFGLPII